MASVRQPYGADPKHCKKCDSHKPRSDFYPHSVSKNGVSTWCKDCSNKIAYRQQRDNLERTKLIVRRSRLKTIYGLTAEQFDQILASQGGGCAICKTKTPRGRGNRFHVDHDHESGKVRGLLCSCCNTAIGQFQDSADLLRSAALYVENGGSL